MENSKIVYAIQHNVTKRIYIGSTGRGHHRIKSHLNLLRRHAHKNKLMQKDFDEYGEDYSFFILDMIPTSFHREREYYWMLIFDTYDPEKGYNVKDYTINHLKITDFPKLEISGVSIEKLLAESDKGR
ncbi:GIY-YIG nuclease family protein [Cuneatibacter sp. NSJ-177]|uniref:GIY-YIG nuclease family protein n=1 Tax=Cuneatibacter sp. NSJ-177 TaxID=2931401 RepID=UPI001FCF89C9|nr:GIY-YIG nuclease family protein [Cuneatibacter sp. NSJ-177]MCJ7837476.1 GIY-YIG nuclease family protein [Cuneatibacter sp. NSJ-177]